MMSPIFDSHAHYNDARFDGDREVCLQVLFENGVTGIVEAGTDLASSARALELAQRYPQIYAAVGIYPHETHLAPEDAIMQLEQLLSHPKAVAIGEIGLDYHYEDSPRPTQQLWFDLQLELSAKTGYPVCVHDREAHGDCVAAVRRHPDAHGMFHSFSGSAQTAKELLGCGWMISFSGTVTFKNAEKLREAVKAVPLDRMLLETDCPYLTPVPYRGERNQSDRILYAAQIIAQLHATDAETVLVQTAQNAKRFYRIAE